MSPRRQTRQTLLAPAQSAAFSMGRALLLFDTWRVVDDAPLELDRGILIDFVLQNPRLFLPLLTDLDAILKAYDLQDAGIADLFAHRRFETARERFQVTVSELVARDLVRERHMAGPTDSAVFSVTEAGRLASARFTTELAQAIRATATVACTQWRRRSPRELQRLIRSSMPDQSSEAARVSRPFGEWLLDMEQ